MLTRGLSRGANGTAFQALRRWPRLPATRSQSRPLPTVQVPRAPGLPRRRHRRRTPGHARPHHSRPGPKAKNRRAHREHGLRAALLRLPGLLRHRVHCERPLPRHDGALWSPAPAPRKLCPH
eukprot:scaffold24017_cov118-Isochrysis_galbana.AAC.2